MGFRKVSSSTPKWRTYFSFTILFLAVFLIFYWQIDPADSNHSPPTAQNRPSVWGKKGIYLTSNFLAQEGNLKEILNHIKRTELNSVVINAKNMRGEVTYDTRVKLAAQIGAQVRRIDLKAIANKLEKEGIYVIARLVVFYDPLLAAYLKSGNPNWVLPSDQTAVAYNLELAKELVDLGVEEIQFDYIRFPDGGLGSDRDFGHRYQSINSFLQQAQKELSGEVNISCDVFGRTLWEWNKKKIDPIGQNLEEFSQYVDILSPMLYPSHFNRRFRDDPYHIVNKTLNLGKKRKLNLRPFIQGFDRSIPPGMSLPEYINAQINAVLNAGVDGFLIWNPRSDYSALWRTLDRRS